MGKTWACQQTQLVIYFGKIFRTTLISFGSDIYTNVLTDKAYSAIGAASTKKNEHGLETIGDLTNNFSILKKCNGKLYCLIAGEP